MKEGIITKGIGGLYYVKTKDGLIESKARGVFRDDNIKPIIGDKVLIRMTEGENTGYIMEIKERESQLTRPEVANVDKSIIVMSITEPEINTWLLDKLLLMSDFERLDPTICINKIDINYKEAKRLQEVYSKAGYKVILTSAQNKSGIEEFKKELKGNISVLSGPSGVGKSSLLNSINKDLKLETGDISKKTERGKHTTRHVELIEIFDETYVLDTPGFSSLELRFIEHESEVRYYFREINEFGDYCKFNSCLHDKEPGCNVKKEVTNKNISEERYNNYIAIMEEVKKIRRY